MTIIQASPYDTSDNEFHFSTAQELEERYAERLPVDEYEFEMVGGTQIDLELSRAWRLTPENAKRFLEVVNEWDNHKKATFIIAAHIHGEIFDFEKENPEKFGISVYDFDTKTELAEYLINEGEFGDISDQLLPYLSYDKIIIGDLLDEYKRIIIAGKTYFYKR